MHLALACPELSGHLNPMTTLGREFVRRGHRVTLVARPDGETKAVAAGLGFAAIGAAEFPLGAIPTQARALGGMTARKALRYTVEMMRLAAEVTLRDLPAVIREHGIDGLLVDQVNPAAGTVAEIVGLPFVKVANALALNRDPACPPAVLPWQYRPGPPTSWKPPLAPTPRCSPDAHVARDAAFRGPLRIRPMIVGRTHHA
jgi:zeaxanthin glucosyltransferase